jgi:hypothetical protein
MIEDALAFPHKQSAAAFQRQLAAFNSVSTLDRLPAISVPTLVLAGGRRHRRPPRLGRTVADRDPRRRVRDHARRSTPAVPRGARPVQRARRRVLAGCREWKQPARRSARPSESDDDARTCRGNLAARDRPFLARARRWTQVPAVEVGPTHDPTRFEPRLERFEDVGEPVEVAPHIGDELSRVRSGWLCVGPCSSHHCAATSSRAPTSNSSITSNAPGRNIAAKRSHDRCQWLDVVQ